MHHYRCPTPDSLIESGSSDSASITVGGSASKKSARKGEGVSEFGSLHSLNLIGGGEDDLDSGIGGGGRGGGGGGHFNAATIAATEAESSPFQLRRISTEVVRRSNSNLHSQHPGVEEEEGSAWDLRHTQQEQGVEELESTSSGTMLIPGHLGGRGRLSQPNAAQAQMQAQLQPPPPVYTNSSRSMSNLHRTHYSPQRPRRRWNVPSATTATAMPTAATPPPPQQQQSAYTPIFMKKSSTASNQPPFHSNTTHQHPQPHQQTPSVQKMSTSASLNTLRNAFNYAAVGDESFSPLYTSSPNNPQQQQEYSPLCNVEAFERKDNSQGRNSFSKRYLTKDHAMAATVGQEKTLWTPSPEHASTTSTAQRRSSNMSGAPIASPFNSSHPEECMSKMRYSPATLPRPKSSMLMSFATSAFPSPPARLLSRFRPNKAHPLSHSHSQRMSQSQADFTSAYPTYNPISGNGLRDSSNVDLRDLSGATDASSFFRSRSQSPSHLALQLAAAASANNSGSNRRDTSPAGSLAAPYSSSRSNLRLSSVTSASRGHSSAATQQTQRLQEAREMLKKSTENLSAVGDANGGGYAPSSSMPRSRSIGNLKMSAAPGNILDSSLDHNATFPSATATIAASSANNQQGQLSEQKRHIARSVNSLHNASSATGGTALTPLNDQYGGGGSRSRLSDAIRGLKNNSIADLNNEELYNNSSGGGEVSDEQPQPQPYYSSTTLPKNNLRRGVQKKLGGTTPQKGMLGVNAELQTTTSGESDSNASASPRPAPMGMRSVSSMEGPSLGGMSLLRGGGPANRRPGHYDQLNGVTTRRTPNYLAQRFGGSEFVAPDICAQQQQEDISAHPSETVAKKMNLHSVECIKEMTQACDKLLGARQLIDSDTYIPASEREKMLVSVDKAIRNFRRRLDSALPVGDRKISDLSSTSNSLSGGGGAQPGASSRHPSVMTSLSEVEINKEFVARNFTRLMQILMELNISSQHQN